MGAKSMDFHERMKNMKNTAKRLLSVVLVLAMVLSMIPALNLAANAATALTGLADSTIGVSADTASNWTVGTNSLSASITGKYTNLVITKYYAAASETLKITNNKSGNAILSFQFSVSGQFSTGSTATVDGTTYSAAATNVAFEKELAAGGSVTVRLDAARNSSKNTIGISITGLSLVSAAADPVDTTFEAPAYGSYTVTYGETSTTMTPGMESVVVSNLPTVDYTFTATPGSGNKLVGWYNVTAGKYVSLDATYVGNFDTPNTIKAIIVPSSSPVFYVGDTYIIGLAEAIAYASANGKNVIALAMNGTVPAGDYTLPAGMTLLLPKDAAYTPMGANPDIATTASTPSAYRTLTMADGANLTVNGTIECEAQLTTLQGSNSARPHGGRASGAYGAVYMSPGSHITLNSGAKMYVWGYIYGDGTIDATSGSSVYESMQVADFPGGSNLAGFVDTSTGKDDDGDGNPANDYIKSFFISQYYVQNIEVALTIRAGAAEYIFASMTVSSTDIPAPPAEFIGANGMFQPKNGYVIKDYNPSTDRLVVDLYGDATIKSIVIDMSGTSYKTILNLVVGTSKFDSSDYILSLNSNLTINAYSGSVTLAQDVALLPGVEIYIAEGATMYVAEQNFADGEMNNLTLYGSGGHNVYVYDLENWGNFVFSSKQLVAASYSPTTGRYKRTASDLKDVVIDVNGTVICDGYIYSTVTVDEDLNPVSGGAAIISSNKTGKIIMNNGSGIEDFAYCLDGTSAADGYVDIDSAWLKNGDGTYLLTDGAEPGAVFAYCADDDCWYQQDESSAVVVDPTCTEAGYTTYTCACGKEYVADEVAALGHNWNNATCTDAKTCIRCGITEGSALGHSYNAVVTAPTCTNVGYTTHTCAICGDSYVTDEVAALGHSYERVTVDPTCTEAGYTLHTCACGDSYVTDEIAALGHTWTDADCDTAKTCSVCGATEGSALGHSYESVTVDPTCTEAGYTTYTCSVCGDTYAEEIAALGHNYEVAVTAPDCVNGGYTTYTCCNCGDSYVADEVAALGHSYESVTVDPTCTEAGSITYTCACGDTYTEGIAALGHNYEADVTEPDCVTGGFTTYTCANCGDSYVDDHVAPTGHNYVGGKCACGDTKTVTINGSFNDWVGDNMTWTENGYTFTMDLAAGTYEFKLVADGNWIGNNGEIWDTTTATSEIGWEFADWGGNCKLVATGGTYYFTYNFDTRMLVITFDHVHSHTAGDVVAPNCTDAGYTVYTCVCGDSYNGDEVAALGHTYEAVVTEPTCTAGGYTTYTCACGDTYVADEVAALGHT